MQTTRRRSEASAAARLTVASAVRVLSIVLLAHFPALLGAQPQSTESELSSPTTARHAEAVDLARAGRHEQALAILRELRTADPDDASLLYDETIVLGWAEHDAAVLERTESIERLDPSTFVLATIGKSARNLGLFETAANWYERALELDPDHVDARLGLAMTYADQGRHSEAERVMDALPDSERGTTEALGAQVYLRVLGGDPFEALTEYENMLARAPEDPIALRGKALALRGLLLPSQALELAERHPGILTDAEVERLKADEVAIRVRLATRTPYRPNMLEAELGTAVRALEERLSTGPAPSVEAALRDDRIVALAQGYRSAAAVEAFEQRGPDEEQPYLLGAVGEAYLSERQPQKALAVLQRAHAGDPDNLEFEFALFHAYLDLEQHDRALEIARDLIDRLPAVQAEEGSPVIKGNEEWVRAQIAAALAEANADDLADAQARLEPLVDEMPSNGDLRHELANVYHWRGWIDRSLFQYAQVLTVDPELLAARVGHAHTQLDARRFGEFETTLASLNETHSPEPAVDALNERWLLHNRSELRLTADTGDSSGATFGTRQRAFDATWLTAPIRARWRGFVHLRDAYADFPEGVARRRRAGVGVEYRDPRWVVTGEVTDGLDGGGAGLRALSERRIGDRWSVLGRLELDSDDTQLRAHRLGIETDLAGATARFVPHESASVDFGLQYRDLSDGNASRAVFGAGRHRLVNRSPWTLELIGELRASSNARQDVPYFSPDDDVSLLAGLSHEWRIFRRYERGVAQTVEAQAGRYRQSGEPDGRIWRLGYELRVDLGRRLALSVGAERYRMFYDGAPEQGTSFVLGLNARL